MITEPMGETRQLTAQEWNAFVESGKIEDISHELADGFLMYGQKMRAKIRFEGKTWMASSWYSGNYIQTVELIEVVG